ncbi:MAG: hypothetical protein AB7L09_03470 [Nitrospira sp.]
MLLSWNGVGKSPFGRETLRIRCVDGVPKEGDTVNLGNWSNFRSVKVIRVVWVVVHTFVFFNPRLEPMVYVASASDAIDLDG